MMADQEPELSVEAQAVLDASRASGMAPVWSLDPSAARERLRGLFVTQEPAEGQAVATVEHERKGTSSLRWRTYRGRESDARTPLFLFLHGGGWVVNSVDTHDNLCRRLAARADLEVASLEYPLAPENHYPAALNTVVLWLNVLDREGVLADRRVVLGGDSAGATLALGVVQDQACPLGAIDGIAALYPSVAHYTRGFLSYASRGSGYNLTADWMRWFWDYYVDPNHVRTRQLDTLLEPLYADLPTGVEYHVVTAEFDPLRDEGMDLVKRLRTSGAAVHHDHYSDQMHGFIMVPDRISAGWKAIDNLGSFVRG